jgi:hypothetical protein
MIRLVLPFLLLLTSLPATGAAEPGEIAPGRARLVLYNASGRTLIGGTYTVRIDGRKVAKLRRSEFTAVDLEPGPHRARVESFREIPFVLEAGRVTHWAVAYSPAKAWGAPLGGGGFGYGVIPDSLGIRLAAEFRRVESLLPAPVPDAEAPAAEP